MKLQFDPNQSYQLDAINSITGIFEGQPLEDTSLEYNLSEQESLNLIAGIANNLILTDEQILKNLQEIQKQSHFPRPDN